MKTVTCTSNYMLSMGNIIFTENETYKMKIIDDPEGFSYELINNHNHKCHFTKKGFHTYFTNFTYGK